MVKICSYGRSTLTNIDILNSIRGYNYVVIGYDIQVVWFKVD